MGNFMCKHYKLRNGLTLAISDTTMASMARSTRSKPADVLRNTHFQIKRCQALLDFSRFDQPKTGENIGMWLSEVHTRIGIKPDFIGSHMVDGAANAGSSVDVLEWTTTGARSQKIIAQKCDAHKASTTASQASGTSTHVKNLNPDVGIALSKLHGWLTDISRNGQRKAVLRNVQQEKGRVKCHRVDPAVLTRWNSTHKETKGANCNQQDLDSAIQRMVSPHGVDAAKYKEHIKNLDDILPTEFDWTLYQQYEAGMEPLSDYITICQTARVMVHMELFECCRVREKLRAPYFTMYENVSEKQGVKDLTVREKNIIVSMEDYVTYDNNPRAYEYDKMERHVMMEEIAIARRASWRLLGIRFGMVERNSILGTSKRSSDVDNDLSFPIDAGLIPTSALSDMKVIGLFANPLFQNSERMIDAGMLTAEQMAAGEVEFVDRLERFHERQIDGNNCVSSGSDDEKLNKWDGKLRQDNGEDSPADKAAKELSMWKNWCKMKYLPLMKPLRVLGAIDDDDQPKEPVYSFGPVVSRGKNLPSKKNHADYVSSSGYYDFVKMLEYHKSYFPAIHSVLVGQAAPVLHTEVDCEGLFNTAGHINHPKRALTAIRNYERLVTGKHRIGRIYCSPDAVHKLFMERFHDNTWDENDDRDDREFLAIEKDICLESCPYMKEEFAEEEASNEAWEQDLKEDSARKTVKSVDKSIKKSGNGGDKKQRKVLVKKQQPIEHLDDSSSEEESDDSSDDDEDKFDDHSNVKGEQDSDESGEELGSDCEASDDSE